MNEQLAPTARVRSGQPMPGAPGSAKVGPIRPNPIGVYAVVVALWLAFAVALLVSSGSLVDLWDRYRDWPLVAQGAAGLLLLPWVVALWVWQTDWPLAVRLVLDAGLAWATLYTFFPRKRWGQVGARQPAGGGAPRSEGEQACQPSRRSS
jgi:hypothetical protein